MKLQWDASTDPDVQGYIVWYGTQSHVYTNSVDVGNSTIATISVNPGSTYYFAVVAYSAGGVSAYSEEVSATVNGSNGFLAIDTPTNAATLTSAFEVGGWAADMSAVSGTGVDVVQFYVFPNDGRSQGVYVGTGSYGWARSDVAAILGSQFTNVGYHFTVTGLGPGAYLLGVYARSMVSGTFSLVATRHFTISATALMSIDVPTGESTVSAGALWVSGWALDRTIERTGLAGSGVDALHVYAYPNPGSGQAPIFLGIATQGVERPDVAAAYGARYLTSGYSFSPPASVKLAPGVYNIVVHARSAATGAFNNVALVRVTIQ